MQSFSIPSFFQWHSSTKSLRSFRSDSHSFNSVRSIIAQELHIDNLLVYASQVSLILCLATSQPHSWPFNRHVHCDTVVDGLINLPGPGREPLFKLIFNFFVGKSTKLWERHQIKTKKCKELWKSDAKCRQNDHKNIQNKTICKCESLGKPKHQQCSIMPLSLQLDFLFFTSNLVRNRF